ncbi:putative ABC transporter permease [Anaerorhabdus sp.]|uniref:putative ABC transporter permease n=1 Tax=Anaerorhabdus sp. TaxID=1872524 RepID=UPI002FC58A74
MSKQRKRFGQGYSFEKIFAYFMVGCVVGVVYETILAYVRHGILQPHVGLIYGPFNPVYGIGFSLFYILLGKNNDKRNGYLTYLYCCLIGGVTEYSISYFEQLFFHTLAWNYSDLFLNIQGRTTIPFMLFWGLGGYVLLKWVYPYLSTWIERIPYHFGKKVTTFLFVFILFDSVISFAAVYRQTERDDGVPATNLVEELLDYYFPNSVMNDIFQNVKVVSK